MTTWFFLVTFLMFGEPYQMRVEAANEAACWRFHRLMVRQMEKGLLRAVLSDCQPATHSEAGT
jgi:hypothetical protein